MKKLFGKDKAPSREELERQAAQELEAATGGVPAAWGGPSGSEVAAASPASAQPPSGVPDMSDRSSIGSQAASGAEASTPPPFRARSSPGAGDPPSSTPPAVGADPTAGTAWGPSAPPAFDAQLASPGDADLSTAKPASEASLATPDIAPGVASSWGSLGAAVKGPGLSDSPLLPPPLTDNQLGEGPLTPQDEEEAVTGLALSQLADRPGLARNPEDIAVRKIDPQSAEEMRNRAIQEFLERKKQRGDEE